MLSKVNKITLQKELQKFMTHSLLELVPKSKTQQQKKQKKSKLELFQGNKSKHKQIKGKFANHTISTNSFFCSILT